MLRVETRFQNALQLHQQGNLEEAARCYESILADNPNHPGAWHFWGVISHSQGDHQTAQKHIERALSFCDTKAVYWNNYGAVLKSMDRFEDAHAAFQRAVRLNPNYADAYSNIGLCLIEMGNCNAAIGELKNALLYDPDHLGAMLHLGNCYSLMHRLREAEACYRTAVQNNPGHASAWKGLGRVLLTAHSHDKAIEAFTRSLQLIPEDDELLALLTTAHAENGNSDKALSELDRAVASRPKDDPLHLRHLTICPAVFQTDEDLHTYREDLVRRLDEAAKQSFRFDWRQCTHQGVTFPFDLAHHGVCNRDTKQRFARVFESYFPQRRPELRVTDRPRVGFLVTPGKEFGFIRNVEHLIPRMDDTHFEPVIVCPNASLAILQKSIRRPDLKWITFSNNFAVAVDQIRDAHCDILYFHQVGTTPFNYFLPFTRLAPIQCVSWVMHGTTGLPMLDYYVSSKLIEHEEAQEQFTERLHLFDTLPTYQIRPPKPRANVTRHDFGLPESGAIYLCPHRIEKFQPSFDPLLKRVLEETPGSHILVPRGRRGRAITMLRERWDQTLGPEIAARILYYPKLSIAQYYELMSLANALLDTPDYSMGWSSFDAFGIGTPVVAIPGKLTVQRYTQAFYQKMGIHELIAETHDEYVKLAVQLGADQDFRQHWHQQITDRSDVLFDDNQAVRDHETFFAECWNRRESLYDHFDKPTRDDK